MNGRKDIYVKAYLTEAEKRSVLDLAAQTRLSVSELVRRLTLGQKLPVPARHEDIRALVKVAGDLARLGNLFKMAIQDDDFMAASNGRSMDAWDVLRDIQRLKAQIRDLVEILDAKLH